MSSYTQDDLANIKSAIASGVLHAQIHGETVQYRSLAEMMQIKKMIEDDLNPAGSGVLAVGYMETGRGL